MNALISSASVTGPTAANHAVCTPAQTPRASATASSCLRILYVEDEPAIRRIGQLTLERAGHRLDTAADGVEGWSSLQEGNHDLLITDNQMPRLTGFELIRKVRLARLTMPIIVASGSLDELPVDELRWLECGPVLRKPFTPGQLLSAVAEVARSARKCEGGTGAQPSVAENVSSGFSRAR